MQKHINRAECFGKVLARRTRVDYNPDDGVALSFPWSVSSEDANMASKAFGELVPAAGGDTIPLIRNTITMGRRESCDVCLTFPDVSGLHCELSFRDGIWYIRDLNSKSGVKVNGQRATQRMLRPGDTIAISKHSFTIHYEGRTAPGLRNIAAEVWPSDLPEA